MKKKLAGILAVLMILTMGTTVFAAPSSDKDSDLKKEAESLVTTVESGSDSVALTTKTVESADLTNAYDYVAEKIGKDTGFTMLAAVELSSAATLPSGGIQITFQVAGLAQGTSNVRIYHKTASGWEVKTPFVGNGYVSARFDSLSPFFVVKYDSTPSDSDGSVDESTLINNYYTTNNTYNNTSSDSHDTSNTYNNTNSNNSSASTSTNSNNATTSTSTNSNNATTSNSTNSNNASTSNMTNSNNTSSNTTNNNAATTKKNTTSKSDTTKKTNTKKSTTKKSTSKNTAAKKSTTKTSISKDESVKVDSSNKNTQTVTVNVNGSGSGSAKAGASTSKTSPKTGASVPVLPVIAVFSVMGIAVCGKKARSL